jgi:acyl carrier protein
MMSRSQMSAIVSDVLPLVLDTAESVLDMPVRPSDNFFSLGGDSVLAVEMMNTLEDRLGTELDPSSIVDADDMAALALSLLPALDRQAARADDAATEPAPLRPARPKLTRLPDDTTAPWSYLQEYMWAGKESCPNPGWNILLTIRLIGPVDVTAVRDAIAFLVQRHEILRTRLDEAGQHVAEAAEPELPVIRLTTTDPRREVAEIARNQHRVCLDLRRGPAIVPLLVRMAADQHVLMLTMDHASCDGWSIGILLEELAAVYDTLAAGGVPRLPPLPVRYRDFSAHQRDLAQGGAFDRQLDYWQRQLAGLATEPMLPRRPDAPASPGYRSGLRSLDIEPELTEAVREVARSTGHTVFMVLLGTLMTSITAVSGRTDVVVATMSGGRHYPEVQDVVGMFANPWLLRADVAAAASCRDLFDAVQSAMAGAYDHATVPFPLVAERVGQQADRPEVWFNMAPPMSSSPRIGTVQTEPFCLPHNYVIEVPAAGWRGENLLVNGMDTGKSLSLEFDYNTRLVEAATIDRLCATYLDTLRAVTSE